MERVGRVVDDRVITSAGVSAGMDMAFHVVAKVCGETVAGETARYIDYPWVRGAPSAAPDRAVSAQLYLTPGAPVSAPSATSNTVLPALQSDLPVVAVELRPPRAELEAAAGIDAWIDTYHAIRGLVRQGVRVMVTDSAVGAQEENNLRHLVNNLGPDVPRSRVVPFLTTKHSLEFCLAYADQVVQHDFPALVVLGGDKHVGRARSVEHAWQLRRQIRDRHPALPLGGWANPAADPARQAAFVGGGDFTADFYLTQIVSHHRLGDVEPSCEADRARGLARRECSASSTTAAPTPRRSTC